MELMNKTEEKVILNRVEPTNDKELNKKLFELYANLVNPMKSIENKMLECKNLRYQGYLVRSEKNHVFLTFLVTASVLLLGIIIMLTIRLIIQDSVTQRTLNIINNFTLYISVIAFFLVPVLLINDKKKCRKKKLLALENEFNNLREEINNDIKILEPYLQYVPPAYRTSRALNYFVDSYINVRVENLSEAVKAYDNYVHQQKVQQEFRQVDARLKEISYMQSQSLSKMHVGINLGGMCLWL